MSDFKLVIVCNGSAKIPMGRWAAQAVHVALNAYRAQAMTECTSIENTFLQMWLDEGGYVVVLKAKNIKEFHRIGLLAQKEDIEVHSFSDNKVNKSEISTLTCMSLGPDTSDTLNKIVGKLKLL
jgi:peptidyl-tRNA hydrolase